MEKEVREQELEKVLQLSKLRIEESDRDMVMQEIEKAITYFEALKEVNTEGILPLSCPVEKKNCFRKDEAEDRDGSGETLCNAKLVENRMFVVEHGPVFREE